MGGKEENAGLERGHLCFRKAWLAAGEKYRADSVQGTWWWLCGAGRQRDKCETFLKRKTLWMIKWFCNKTDKSNDKRKPQGDLIINS